MNRDATPRSPQLGPSEVATPYPEFDFAKPINTVRSFVACQNANLTLNMFALLSDELVTAIAFEESLAIFDSRMRQLLAAESASLFADLWETGPVVAQWLGEVELTYFSDSNTVMIQIAQGVVTIDKKTCQELVPARSTAYELVTDLEYGWVINGYAPVLPVPELQGIEYPSGCSKILE